MSAATRMRRLDETAEIVVIERSGHVSFANCGLPYHVGGVIEEREDLLLQTPASLKERFNLDVRVNHEVVAIDREQKQVQLRDASGATSTLPYDALVLSPGARPVRPPGIFFKVRINESECVYVPIAKPLRHPFPFFGKET